MTFPLITWSMWDWAGSQAHDWWTWQLVAGRSCSSSLQSPARAQGVRLNLSSVTCWMLENSRLLILPAAHLSVHLYHSKTVSGQHSQNPVWMPPQWTSLALKLVSTLWAWAACPGPGIRTSVFKTSKEVEVAFWWGACRDLHLNLRLDLGLGSANVVTFSDSLHFCRLQSPYREKDVNITFISHSWKSQAHATWV